MAGPRHIIDPSLGNDTPNLSKMGLTAAEQRALNMQVDPSTITDEYRQHDNKESSWMEQQELQRAREETDRLRAELGQSQQQVQEVQTQHANLAGQVQAMQQAQALAAQQNQLDTQYGLSAEELENHGELLPVIDKIVGRNAAQLQADYDAKMAAELAKMQQATAAPLQSELDQLKRQNEINQAQVAQNNAAQLNQKVRDLGLGTIESLTQNEEFLKRHAAPLYPGATKAWGDELTEHIKAGNILSAESMLEDFRDNSETFRPRDTGDNSVVPTGRNASPQAPLSTQQTQNLNKRDHLLGVYQQRMENANNGVFPEGMNRSQYRQAQTELMAEIDKIPTT